MRFEERKSEHSSWNEERKRLLKIIQVFANHNIEIKPGSRLYRYQRILDALKEESLGDFPKNFNKKELRQISIEIYQLSHAVVELNKSNSFKEWAEKLKFLVSGRELPEKDLNYSPRNYQFELYVAGLIKKSGIEPICDEPDIRIKWNSSYFGIAIKRPNSFKQLDENLRRARNQILKTNQPGIIFVDVSRISNPENYICVASSIHDVTNHLINYLEVFFDKNYGSMKNIVNEKSVFGIALHISCLSDVNNRLGHSSRITIRNFCSENSSLINNLNFFANSLKNSL